MANPIVDKISKLNAEIERLRAENSHLRRVGVDGPSPELHEAALASLREETDRLRTKIAMQAAALADLRAENERLRAKNERLRALVEVMERAVGYYLDKFNGEPAP